MTAKYRMQRLVLGVDTVGGWLDYIIDRGPQIESLAQDGAIHEQGQIVPQVRPSIELQGANLAAIFGWAGSSDLPLLVPGAPGLVAYGALQASNGPGLAGSAHRTHTAANIVLACTGLAWSQGQAAAVATVMGMPYGATSTTDPIIEAPSASVPAAAPAEGFAWRPTVVTVGGAAVANFESVSLAIDPALEPLYQDGGWAPTGVAGTGAPIVASLEVETAAIAATVGSGACSVVFRRLAKGGGFASGADTQLTVTLNGSYAWKTREGGGAGATRRASLVVRSRHDGTNRPLTWALAST